MPLICIDCRYIGPRVSGIATVVQALVDHLPELAPDIDFLLLKHPLAAERLSPAANVREIVVKAAANGPVTMWALPLAVDLSRVSLFHATANIMPANLRMPCVTTVHDVMWLTHPEWCKSGPTQFIDRAFYRHGIRRALQRAEAVATVSEASRQQILALDPHLSDRVCVTPLAASGEYRRQEVAPGALAQLGLDPNRRFVLTVGQYVPYKNHEGAIRAFARLADAHRDVDLVLVQRRNPNSAHLHALACTLGIESRVHFLTNVSEHDMTMLYSGASALLHPSYCEGFGLPLVEAMACGCPIVASDRAAIPEVVGDAALVAPPDDHAALAAALGRILAEPALADRLHDRGQKRAAKMSWRRFAEANLAIYRKLLS